MFVEAPGKPLHVIRLCTVKPYSYLFTRCLLFPLPITTIHFQLMLMLVRTFMSRSYFYEQQTAIYYGQQCRKQTTTTNSLKKLLMQSRKIKSWLYKRSLSVCLAIQIIRMHVCSWLNEDTSRNPRKRKIKINHHQHLHHHQDALTLTVKTIKIINSPSSSTARSHVRHFCAQCTAFKLQKQKQPPQDYVIYGKNNNKYKWKSKLTSGYRITYPNRGRTSRQWVGRQAGGSKL